VRNRDRVRKKERKGEKERGKGGEREIIRQRVGERKG
jgi:hypothetical protein